MFTVAFGTDDHGKLRKMA